MKQSKLLLALLSIFVISSCSSPFMSYNSLGTCEKNNELDYYYDEGSVGDFDVEFEEIFTLEDMSDGSNIDILVYETLLHKTNRLLIFPMPIVWSTKTYSLLAFENGKLIYWGFPEEFLKSDDKRIREIGKKAVDKIYTEIIN